jgi:hypothetical protein
MLWTILPVKGPENRFWISSLKPWRFCDTEAG